MSSLEQGVPEGDRRILHSPPPKDRLSSAPEDVDEVERVDVLLPSEGMGRGVNKVGTGSDVMATGEVVAISEGFCSQKWTFSVRGGDAFDQESFPSS
ncbi:hypothetical protein AVEN_15101-1 [Araneus ventricosus]|uniref:Uncharacterized protein n=1 Tax=Araneus ventricosus TaxID=182803 RepID=A0A4Y2GC39_ARAVE|nr:hypothetical protein AVEN_15101-1 [Araneus ventricosus]